MNRLFIALPVDKKIVEHIFNKIEKKESYKLFKWEKKENIHITLKFLGDTEENLIPFIDKELKEIANKFEHFSLTLNKLGTFNRNGNPVILWFNFYKNEIINLLQKEIEQNLEKIGFRKEEREFLPHVTLLRIKNERDAKLIKSYKEIELEPIEYVINEFYLVKSKLTSQGSIYTKVKTYKLK
jgi:2'-5' RNA ligase